MSSTNHGYANVYLIRPFLAIIDEDIPIQTYVV